MARTKPNVQDKAAKKGRADAASRQTKTEGRVPGHKPSKFYEEYKKRHGDLLAAMGKVD